MGFGEAIGAFYRGYFNFNTRSSRSEFWWPKLFKTIIYILLFIVIIVIAATVGDLESDEGNLAAGIVMMLMGLFYIANIIPNIAVAVRRFHDQDQSGWMFLLSLIPYVGGLVVTVFMCIDGTHGENRFGEDPLGDSMFDTFS